MDKAEDLASGTFYLTLMQASQYAIVFVFYIIVARVLSPGEVGSFSLLLMVMGVFNTLTLLALNNAVIRYISESLGRGDEESAIASSRSAFKLILCVSIPALILAFALSPTIACYVGTGVLDVLCILASAFMLNLTSYYGALMFGFNMFREVSLQNIIYVFSSRILGVSIAYLGFRVLGLSVGFLAGSAITLLYSLFVLRGRIKPCHKGFPSEELLRFSMPLYGGNVILLVQGWLDVAILSSLVGLGGTGTYYIAASSIAPLTILWTPLSSALFPTLSYINGKGDSKEIEETHRKVLNLATAVILPLSTALASVSHTALSIAYGERYSEASIPLSILSAFAILNAYTSIYSTELQSVGKTKPIFKAGVASTLTYIALLLLLTAPLRQVGAALARASVAIVGFMILYRELGLRLPENLKKSLTVAVIIAAAVAPIELLLQTNTGIKASVEAIAFAITLPIAYKITKPLNRGEMELMKKMVPQKLIQLADYVR